MMGALILMLWFYYKAYISLFTGGSLGGERRTGSPEVGQLGEPPLRGSDLGKMLRLFGVQGLGFKV